EEWRGGDLELHGYPCWWSVRYLWVAHPTDPSPPSVGLEFALGTVASHVQCICSTHSLGCSSRDFTDYSSPNDLPRTCHAFGALGTGCRVCFFSGSTVAAGRLSRYC